MYRVETIKLRCTRGVFYTIRCTVYNVHSTVHISTIYSKHSKLYGMHCICVHYTLYISMYDIHYTVYSTQQVAYSVRTRFQNFQPSECYVNNTQVVIMSYNIGPRVMQCYAMPAGGAEACSHEL